MKSTESVELYFSMATFQRLPICGPLSHFRCVLSSFQMDSFKDLFGVQMDKINQQKK